MELLGNLQSASSKPFVFDGKYLIPQEIVDDIICRYLLNIPKEEKFDPIRVCFQIELAHWFFLDYYCGEGCTPSLAHLHNMPYNQFACIMFQETPHLRPRLPEIEKHLSAFREYKMRVPTFGAILMDQNLSKVVLVQGFRNNWGFPKGKVNEMEDPVSCAIREVFEETGYDISPLVNANHYIESKVHERNDRLYLIRGVDLSFPFQPQTQFEIKNIKWFNICELPEHKKDTNPAITKHGVPVNNFYSVYSYIRRLKLWVTDKLEGRNKLHNFKVRPEPENSVQTTSSSSSLQKSKSSDHVQKPGKTLVPFQFPDAQITSGLENVTIGGGWKLFPAGGSSQPYMLNSNAIQELILGQPQHLNQNPRPIGSGAVTNSNSKAVGKGARRRLFSTEETQLQASQQSQSQGQGGSKQQQHSNSKSGVVTNQKPASSQQTPGGAPRSARSVNSPNRMKSSKPSEVNANVSKSSTSTFNAPAWANFSFDRERVYKAFFTPPQTIN